MSSADMDGVDDFIKNSQTSRTEASLRLLLKSREDYGGRPEPKVPAHRFVWPQTQDPKKGQPSLTDFIFNYF